MARHKQSSEDVKELMRGVPLFSDCTDKELASLAGAAKLVEHHSGDVICREGQSGVGMHVIAEGEVRVEVGGETKRHLGTGSFFGEVALLDGGPRTATVVAESPVVRTYSLTFWSFRDILSSSPDMALKMLKEVCRRLRQNESAMSH
jgi:CRP/FNR family transcriptional regulator, cyclic AMP receptor protein